MRRKTLGMKIFTVFNYAFLTLLAISCLLPMLNQLAISFSSSSAVAAGEVGLLPVDFTLDSYKYMADKPEFWKSLSVSLGRILLAVPISMIVCVLAAFPLSRLDHEFPARKYYIWVFVVPMLIGGGLIPTYMVVRNTGLIDSIWSLVLPNAVNVFNTILLMNFFRSLPKELEEPYQSYNVLQRAQGFDLEPCCGKTVERCTYTVKNHPSGKVCQADLYICGGEIVAGDILCTGEGGFIAPLAFPKDA